VNVVHRSISHIIYDNYCAVIRRVFLIIYMKIIFQYLLGHKPKKKYLDTHS
jgi:hypothetical protein